ncbi:MAG: EAL domain-containing protein [Gammaproteobacteria bacterium]
MPKEVIVGRQAIFDRDLRLVAYELLFRERDGTTTATIRDGDDATFQVIENTLYEIGFHNLVEDKPAFINLTRSFIDHPALERLRKDEVVLEILEDVEIDERMLARLSALSRAGYTIALDDFLYDPKYKPLIDIADIVKVDLNLVGSEVLPTHVEELRRYRVKLLAEKIETKEQLQRCQELGFDLYQGYLLGEPDTVTLATLKPESGETPDPNVRRRR